MCHLIELCIDIRATLDFDIQYKEIIDIIKSIWCKVKFWWKYKSTKCNLPFKYGLRDQFLNKLNSIHHHKARERERERELYKMGHHSCCNQQKVKRGLWSPEEDEKLIRYITTHGYGCWSEVPEKAGLSLSLRNHI